MLKREKRFVEQTAYGKVTCKQKHANCVCMINTEFLYGMAWCVMICHEKYAVLAVSERLSRMTVL
jgi:hypothetical protein